MEQARRNTGKFPVFSYEDREKAESLVKARDIARNALKRYLSTPIEASDEDLEEEIDRAIDLELAALGEMEQLRAQRTSYRAAG